MADEDSRLAERVAAGEPAAFDALYDRYGRALYGYLLGLTGRVADAEDLLQDVMLRLVRSRKRIASVRNLRAYLYTAARNEWHRRRPAKAASSAALRDRTDPTTAGAAPDIAGALARLAPERAEVVALKLRYGLTFAEIGEVLDVSPNTAASRYRYALSDLARILEMTDVRR